MQSNNKYKTSLCKLFEATGSCNFGLKCSYAHGAHELRRPDDPVPREAFSERNDRVPYSNYKTIKCCYFYRDGFCNTGADDAGLHVVCARVTDDFLSYSRSQGNDLVTPRGGFPGLRPGDGWCLCARRWQEAFEAGAAPPVVLESTHQAALKVSTLSQLSGAKE